MKNSAQLQRDVLDELLWDTSINPANIEVAADDGSLTLTGKVAYQFERQAAADAVRLLVGLKGVNNQIRITPSVRTREVKQQIEKALVRNVETDARNIRVEAFGGKVTLRGTVRSWAEHRAASRAAWAAPGSVHDVDNELSVGDIP
jgi:osmotically-inducible protein OsmY